MEREREGGGEHDIIMRDLWQFQSTRELMNVQSSYQWLEHVSCN